MNGQIATKKGSVLGAALFIAATSIGIFYFTIPIVTGIAGFIPAVLMTFLVWGFTLAIALLFAEATLGQPDGAHFVSISRALLGKVPMIIFAVVFFVDIFSFLTAYAFFAEKFLIWFLDDTFHIHLSPFLIGLLSILPFFLIIFGGVTFSCNINIILMSGLAIFFFLTVYLGSEFVTPKRFLEHQWIYIFFSVPTLFSALGFVGIVPPICSYLNRDPKKIRLSMWIGTLITFCVYLIWQWFLIGSIPTGTFWANFEEGISVEQVFVLLQKFPKVAYFFQFTLFFSMITSMIGNGTATVEFLCDAVNLSLDQRKGWRRLAICLSLAVLIVSFSLIHGSLFLALLQNFTAPVGEVLVNGIIPVWMVAQARYVHLLAAPEMLPGGRISLIVLGIAIFILIYLEGIALIRS